MAAESVATEKHDVHCQDQRAEANAKVCLPGRRINKPHGFPNVVREQNQKQERNVKEVAMDVLHHEWKRTFAEISLPRLANSAGRRVSPETLVVSAAIIIAGQPEQAGRPENQERGRERQPVRPPAGLRTEDAVL